LQYDASGVIVAVMDRDSLVGIATCCGLDGLGIEVLPRRRLPHPSSPVLGPAQPSCTMVPGLFPEDKAAVAWRLSFTPTSTDFKERVEYTSTPSEPLWPVTG
jgi:hypothetical protein